MKNEHVKWHNENRIKKTIENFKKNQMEAFYVDTVDELENKIKELIKENSLVSVGGSMTLFETGIIELLRNGKYDFLDRYQDGLSKEQIKDIYRKSFSADTYLASSNAITENGEIYNVDGTGNRVAAMIYGPDQVIIVVGINKLVKDEQSAITRNREIAAPINAKRLNRKTPCSVTGVCSDCSSPDRICTSYTMIKKQMNPDRIKILIVGESFGF